MGIGPRPPAVLPVQPGARQVLHAQASRPKLRMMPDGGSHLEVPPRACVPRARLQAWTSDRGREMGWMDKLKKNGTRHGLELASARRKTGLCNQGPLPGPLHCIGSEAAGLQVLLPRRSRRTGFPQSIHSSSPSLLQIPAPKIQTTHDSITSQTPPSSRRAQDPPSLSITSSVCQAG